MTARRRLTDAERSALIDLGWTDDDDGWWWQPNTHARGEAGCHVGHTDSEALRAALRIGSRAVQTLRGTR